MYILLPRAENINNFDPILPITLLLPQQKAGCAHIYDKCNDGPTLTFVFSFLKILRRKYTASAILTTLILHCNNKHIDRYKLIICYALANMKQAVLVLPPLAASSAVTAATQCVAIDPSGEMCCMQQQEVRI